MTPLNTPSRAPARPGSDHHPAVQATRPWTAPQLLGGGPCCSLRARPMPQPTPAPSWEELFGRR